MISIKDLNPNLLNAEYAVRGAVLNKAMELEKKGMKIIYCNIGNPQALKQKPLTYLRQIISILEYPDILNNEDVNKVFPKDIVENAKNIHKLPHGTGAYTQSAGLTFVRQAIAESVTKRDVIPSDEDHIMLTDGEAKVFNLF